MQDLALQRPVWVQQVANIGISANGIVIEVIETEFQGLHAFIYVPAAVHWNQDVGSDSSVTSLGRLLRYLV